MPIFEGETDPEVLKLAEGKPYEKDLDIDYF